MSTKNKVDGNALKVVRAISTDSSDELNNRRFSRLCGMLRSQDIVWRILEQHGKDQVMRETKERLGSSASA